MVQPGRRRIRKGDRGVVKIRQVTIEGHRIGLVGLEEVFAEVGSRDFASQRELAEAIVRLVAERNYVPDALREAYGSALLREYRIERGESVDEDDGQATRPGPEVRVYGRGCVNCERLAALIVSALAQLGLKADFEQVKDMNEIGALGPIGMPALSVNGRIVAAGRIPSRERILELLKEATE